MLDRDSKFFRLGLTLLTVIVLSVLFSLTLINIGTIFEFLEQVLSVFSFVIFGIIFAYLMNPIMMAVEKPLRRLLSRSNMTERGAAKLSRGLGVAVSVLVFLLIVYSLLAMVIPTLLESLSETFSQDNLQHYYEQVTSWLNDVVRGTPAEDWIHQHDLIKALQDWIAQKSEDIIKTLVDALTGVYGAAMVIFRLVIGLVAAIYLLISKERFLAQLKKLVVSVFRPKGANRIFEIGRLANRSFGGFLIGKLIDSLIIGVISYIGLVILNVPYALLSSVFIGLTNIIPFFGPFIGIAIGGILILLQSPFQAFVFLIFEIILQQVDGNIIGPRILGGRLGISDFWILVSITVFGSFFGFPGMLMGVPVFTIIYTLVAEAVNKALRKKHLPEKTTDYYSILTVEDLKQKDKEFGEATVLRRDDGPEEGCGPEDEFEYDEADSTGLTGG